MGRCTRCGKGRFLRKFPERLAVPELRAMVSHWPWHRVEVCPACEPAFQREFSARLMLLAPEAVATNGDVTERVCLMCGRQDGQTAYRQSGRWVDVAGTPVAGRFHVCQACRGKIVANRVVSASELHSTADFRKLLALLPKVTDDLVQRTDGWRPSSGQGPAGSSMVRPGLSPESAASEAAAFWIAPPGDVAQAADRPVRGAALRPDASGAIRTHLELQWRSDLAGPAPRGAALRFYRAGDGYAIVRFDRPVT
jgi:hypothetical protein